MTGAAFAWIVAAMASGGAAPDSPPASTSASTDVSPLTVTATPKKPPPIAAVVGDDHNWTYRPPNAEILSVWPVGAYQARISGRAVLSCKVDIHGLAEECAVLSETPRGKGFGKAALLLRPTFTLKPAQGAEGPMDSTMSVTVVFDAENNDQIEFAQMSTQKPGADNGRTAHMNGTGPEMREVTMLDRPIWARAASFEDLAAAYPAQGGGVEGFAVAHCKVERSGAMGRCEPRKEVPENHGFGAAAVALGAHFAVAPELARPRRGAPLWVDIPIRFPPPGGAEPRTVRSPTWLAGFDPAAAPKLFPPEAAAKGVTSGRGVAQCVVAADGSLTGCVPLPGDPEGLGFSQAAVKLASVMRMNPWTADGAPVDGAVIRLPIRLTLAGK